MDEKPVLDMVSIRLPRELRTWMLQHCHREGLKVQSFVAKLVAAERSKAGRRKQSR